MKELGGIAIPRWPMSMRAARAGGTREAHCESTAESSLRRGVLHGINVYDMNFKFRRILAMLYVIDSRKLGNGHRVSAARCSGRGVLCSR